MAWSFGDGFDCYTVAGAEYVNGYWDSGANVGNFNLGTGRFSGSRALQWSLANATLVKSSGANDAVHHLVVSFQQTAAITGSTLGVYFELFDGVTAQCSVVFRTDGAILLTSGGPGGVTLATYAGAFPVSGTWYSFEFEIVVHNSTGSFKVRKNGNNVDDHSTTGIDTAGGTANNYANKLQVGMNTAVTSSYVDDLFWRSDASSVAWLGDIRCHTRMPASDASAQFSRTPTGVLTQTVPTSIASNTVVPSNNIAYYTAFTAAYSGTVTGVGVAVTGVGNAVNMKCAIHADNALGTGPGSVLASATAPVTPVVVGTNSFTFSGVTVVKGVQYWVGADTDGTINMQYGASSGTSAQGASAAMAYASFPQASPVVTVPAKQVQMSWTYTATPANWQAVSEAQQDTTTSYVYDSVVGHEDFYGIAAIASTPSTVIAVTTRGYMQKSDAGTRTAAVQIKSGGTTVASSTLVLTTSGWQWAWRTDLTDPATGAAWTPVAVNNVTIGPKTIA